MRAIGGTGARYSFWVKVAAGFGLVGLADVLLFKHRIGATLAAFALAWLVSTIAVRPAVWRDRRARLAALTAGLACLLLVDRPTPVGWCLFGAAMAVAALSPRAGALPDAWAWACRLGLSAVISLGGPAPDLLRLQRLRPDDGTFLKRWALAAILPLGGGLVFLWLFAAANPLIAGAIALIRFPNLDPDNIGRVVFWGLVFVMVWATLRPMQRPLSLHFPNHAPKAPALPFVAGRQGSIIAALVVFNALFAVENGLDLAFLWSGARLPSGVTLADYAHRGAYPLIFTALLAAGFSLFVLREGSPSARAPPVRPLVGLWVAQNVFLAASCLLRTVDYVQAYSLTRLRLAALLWMGLVLVGLALIGWRILRGKSASWLINANALVLVFILLVADVADLGAVAAWWNVRHAREVGGAGFGLDVCYLRRLGPAALLPLIEVEQRPIGAALRGQVQFARREALETLTQDQSDWRGWTARGAWRLWAAEPGLRQLPAGPAAHLAAEPCVEPVDQPKPPAPATPTTPTPPPGPTPTLTPGEKP